MMAQYVGISGNLTARPLDNAPGGPIVTMLADLQQRVARTGNELAQLTQALEPILAAAPPAPPTNSNTEAQTPPSLLEQLLVGVLADLDSLKNGIERLRERVRL